MTPALSSSCGGWLQPAADRALAFLSWSGDVWRMPRLAGRSRKASEDRLRLLDQLPDDRPGGLDGLDAARTLAGVQRQRVELAAHAVKRLGDAVTGDLLPVRRGGDDLPLGGAL